RLDRRLRDEAQLDRHRPRLLDLRRRKRRGRGLGHRRPFERRRVRDRRHHLDQLDADDERAPEDEPRRYGRVLPAARPLRGGGGLGITIDVAHDAYLTGLTSSTNFPTTAGAFATSYGGGANDAFVTKFNPGGGTLGYSTYLGGSGDDRGQGIALDSANDAHVV